MVTGKHTECNKEEIVLSELRQTSRRHLNSNLGNISPVPHGQEYYSPSKVIVWQLQTMEGHRVYLELSQIDLHNEDGNCSDYIEISFNPCTPPMKICDNRVNSYTWATSQTRVQVRFVSDHSKPTMALGSEEHITTIQSTLAVSPQLFMLTTCAVCVQVLVLLYAAHLHPLPLLMSVYMSLLLPMEPGSPPQVCIATHGFIIFTDHRVLSKQSTHWHCLCVLKCYDWLGL